MSDDTSFDAELRALLAEGRKIEAIKRYREATGARACRCQGSGRGPGAWRSDAHNGASRLAPGN